MIDNMKVCVLIAAAGMSNRMKSDINKTFLLIDGKPVLAHTIQKFEKSKYVDEIIVLAREEEIDYVNENIIRSGNFKKVIDVISGGNSRQSSIKNGLERLDDDVDIVLTQDGARPFVHVETIDNAIESVLELRAVVVGVPVKDTIKSVYDDGGTKVYLTPKRSLLWSAQTPQVFYAEDLKRAYIYAEREGIEGTDDSSLIEKYGLEVSMVMGSYDNIKITTPEDLVLAKLFAKSLGEQNV